jgi:PAS domain S-box-containing protein
VQLSQFNRIVQQVLILPILALLLIAGALYWQIRTANGIVDRIQLSDAAIAQTHLVGAMIFDQETGLRGYQITSDPRFLEPFNVAESTLPANLEKLQALTSAIPTEPAWIARLKADKEEVRQLSVDYQSWRESFAAPVLAAMRNGGNRSGGDAGDDDLNLQGKALMDVVRKDLVVVAQSAEARRMRRVARWKAQIRTLEEVLAAVALLGGILIGLFTISRLHAVSDAYQLSLTKLRLQSEQVYASEQQLRTTLASIGDGVIACDPEGRVAMMNEVACELTGWTMNEAAGLPIETVFNIINETSREIVENPVAKVKRLNRIVGLANHTILIRRDGVELNIDDSGAPIRNPEGELTGVVMVFRDITMEKRTRDALVANEKLAVAGRLAATIAHEIHNPLDSVSNLLYLMQSGSTAEESAQFLELARQELARVTQISRSMLSLYRESQAPVLLDLKEMLADTLLLLERRFQDLGVKVEAEFEAGHVIEGFPAELRQVFTNLVTNAAEAAGSGGLVTVRVMARPRFLSSGERQSEGALIEIEDNGPGIAPSLQEKLFQPFVSTKGEKGTGLGLWVSRGIIRKHGGDLTLENLPDRKGVVATVSLARHPVIRAVGE